MLGAQERTDASALQGDFKLTRSKSPLASYHPYYSSWARMAQLLLHCKPSHILDKKGAETRVTAHPEGFEGIGAILCCT